MRTPPPPSAIVNKDIRALIRESTLTVIILLSLGYSDYAGS